MANWKLKIVMKNKASTNRLVPAVGIEAAIYFVRRQKVMFDSDLARLYGVETGNLNKAVKRNAERFPEDFMFQLTREELKNLSFQIGCTSP
jgi:hypothetical protein